MQSFRQNLRKKIIEDLYKKLDASNHDEERFGKFRPKQNTIVEKVKTTIKRFLRYKKQLIADSYLSGIDKYETRLQRIFDNLNQKDRDLLVHLVALRILGSQRVKLPQHNPSYWKTIKEAEKLQVGEEIFDPNFRHFLLQKFDLSPLGIDIRLFFGARGIAVDFMIEQYAYKQNGHTIISAEKGDTVIDAGGCWGDTALYFADKVGPEGKVFSFEFIPNNIKIFNMNIGLNPAHQKRIELVQHPVSDKSDLQIYFKDDGPASRIELSSFAGQTGQTTTLSIDDFVSRNQIEKVDFIKMDIEGAEPAALSGAINTIRKFKPKLAIATYHSMEDFTSIPNWILDLNLGYELYLDHFTIHEEETIIYAKVNPATSI